MAENKVHTVYTKSGTLGYLLKGSLHLFIIGVILNLLLIVFNMALPQILSFTIDSVLGEKEVESKFAWLVSLLGGIEIFKNSIWIAAVGILICGLLQAITEFSRKQVMTCASQVFMKRTRNTLFSHLQRLPLSWHFKHMTGDLIQRCTSDTNTILEFVRDQLTNLLRIFIILVLSLVFMFTMNVKLTLIACAFVPIIIVVSLIIRFRANKKFKQCDEEEGKLSAIAQENFTGVRVVRAFGKEKYERDKFEKQNVYYTGLWTKIGKLMTGFWAFNGLIIGVQYITLLSVGSYYCIQGTLTAGQLIAFLAYCMMLMGPIQMLGRLISNLSKAGVALNRISEILNAEEEVYGDAEQLSGDIEFKNVSFEYEEGKKVLNDISFTIPQGTTLGIVGGTGSGKSSITLLFDKLYDISDGDILIGGKSIKDISIATLRKNIGLIIQESYIYSRTLFENIGIATENCDIENIKKYAKIAHIHDNIEGFAKGYDTEVGERGVTLSGGQKQRVAIARTIIRELPYVIFDDSLSAVDSETDASIRANLKELHKDTTSVIISHRITTVMHADNIIVLDKGSIVESGTHEQLLKNNGIYSKLYDIQMSLPDELKEELKKEGANG